LLYPGARLNRVSLPKYPFAREHYWAPRLEDAPNPLMYPVEPPVESRYAQNAPVLEFTPEVMLQQVTRMVAKLLKISVETVNVDENLKRYGFDSLTGARLANMIEKEVGCKIPLKTFFELSSVKDISGYLTGALARGEFSPVLASPAGPIREGRPGARQTVAASREASGSLPPPGELGSDFRKRFSLFLLGELKAGVLTPEEALELEERVLGEKRREPLE
jgi:acyl carrier protein